MTDRNDVPGRQSGRPTFTDDMRRAGRAEQARRAHQRNRDAITAILADKPGGHPRYVIADRLGKSRSATVRALNLLIADGTVVTYGHPVDNRTPIYKLAADRSYAP